MAEACMEVRENGEEQESNSIAHCLMELPLKEIFLAVALVVSCLGFIFTIPFTLWRPRGPSEVPEADARSVGSLVKQRDSKDRQCVDLRMSYWLDIPVIP